VSYVRIVNNHFRTGDVMSTKSILVGAAIRGAALRAAIAAAGIGFAAAAGAQTGDQAPKLVVHYSPASLDTDRGVRQLYSRLVNAAESVCAQLQVGRVPTEATIACRKQALADAVAHIHNSRLADLSARRSKIG
jgi:UrcA family protein